jgi:hypothetical protein
MGVPKFIESSLLGLKDFSGIKVMNRKIVPFGAQTFSTSGTRDITFKVGRESILVPSRSYYYFQMKVDGDAASDDSVMDNIHCIFDQLRVEIGSIEVFSENEHGWSKTLEFDAYASSTDRESVSSTVQGIPARTDNSGAFKKYRIPLSSIWNRNGFFKDVLPLYKLDQMTITWTLNNNLVEFTTATTAVTSLDVQNCELELYLIDSPELRSVFDRDIVRSFDTFYHYHATLPSGATQLTVNVPSAVQNLRGLAMLQRYSADVIDPDWETGGVLATQKYNHSLVLNSLSKFSVSIDGKQFPEKPIDGTNNIELVANLERFWGVADTKLGAWFDNDTLDDTDSKGYYAVAFSATDEGVSGMSLVSKSGTVVVNADLNVVANTDVDIFLKYSKFYKIAKDGSFSTTR